MAPVVAVHSFRRGTGKSTLVANLATLLAVAGKRIGVVDANLEAPSLPGLLGYEPRALTPTLNDFLGGRCTLRAAAQEMTNQLGSTPAGRLFLIAAAADGALGRKAGSDYDLVRLDAELRELVNELKLDAVFLDTRSGVNEESMMALTVADRAVVVLRLDKQDYQGTAVVIDLTRKLELPETVLVVNPTPATFDPRQVSAEVEKTYQCRVVSVLPFAEELMSLGGEGPFVLRHPTHPLTRLFAFLAAQLITDGPAHGPA